MSEYTAAPDYEKLVCECGSTQFIECASIIGGLQDIENGMLSILDALET